MSHLVFLLGRWIDLCPQAVEQYLCQRCKMPVSPGNDVATSFPHSSFTYSHYGKCVSDASVKKSRKKRARKNEHKG